MTTKNVPHILILGATGTLGRIVFTYLKSKYPVTTWGTHRMSSRTPDLLIFNAQTAQLDFKKIFSKLNRIDYVINCIGAIKENEEINNLIEVNSLLPHRLEQLAKKYHFKLIHVSTDAVFSEATQSVDEKTAPNPTGNYGLSKLLGETASKNAITFRTSILGLDPVHRKGILEWVLRGKEVKTYANQVWSGCTVLQFAKLCKQIIFKKQFANLRKKSPVFHFAPLGPVTKYKIIKAFLKLVGKKTRLGRAHGSPMTRVLKTLYFDYLSQNEYTNNINLALRELLLFEKQIQ